jgi:uncharacterized protein YndB with AHSA1/START domain
VAAVEVTRDVRADPLVVYELVSDVTRMGQWSPETTSCRWLGDATGPAVGARFRGTNRHGLRRWSTTCTVTAADPGRRFAFDVDFAGVAVSTWSYDLAAAPIGCTVTESWTDRRPLVLRVASVPVMGVADRDGHNRRGMEATLEAVARAAEASPSAPS